MQTTRNTAAGTMLLALLAIVSMTLLAVTPAAVAREPAGSGPENALTPTGEWQPLEPEDSLWYAFYYLGDGSQIDVHLEVVPEDGAEFAVWVPEAVERRSLGLEAAPVGRGSADPSAPGALVWSGSFNTEGAYYAVVEHTGSQPGTSHYRLDVQGEGVSLSEPVPATVSEPEPIDSPPKPAAASDPAGRLVFQTTVGGDIYIVNVDGTGLRRVADGLDPIWSPNGREIAFVRWQESGGVWVVDADTGNEWRAFDWDKARWPSWSPDGGRILFSRQHGGRTGEVEKCFWRWCFTLPPEPHWKLAIVRMGDGALTEPLCSEFSRAPAWSPVGDRIVYADGQGLRVQSEDGQVSYAITDDPRDTAPVWSPDGSRVAFTRRQHDHWEVYVVDADGRNLRRLTDTPQKPGGELGNSAAAAWSPDGGYLAFLTDRTGRWEIWVMRAGGGEQRPMFDGTLDGLSLEYGHIGDRTISWTK